MKSFVSFVFSSLIVTAGALACSEATDPYATNRGSGADASVGDDASAEGEPTTGTDAAATKPKKDAAAPSQGAPIGVVVNEINASAEWIELFNTRSTTVDLGGYRVADREKDAGTPKLSEALELPSGTTLAGGAYLIVAGNAPKDGGSAPCPVAVNDCFSASWGISNKEGEIIFLLAPDGSVVDEAEYPPSAAPKGSTWSRTPNGTGDFAIAAPSPGASTP